MTAVAPDPTASAKRTTSSMLKEIKSGTALALLNGARYNTSPPGPTFVPALDELLNDARPHPAGSSLQRGDLIEVIGSSGSGKTALLTFILMTFILPSSISIPLPPPGSPVAEAQLGGRSGYAAILQPVSHPHFVISLAKSMKSHIVACVLEALSVNLKPRKLTSAISSIIDETVNQSLKRLSVIRFRPRWRNLALALKRVYRPPDFTTSSSMMNDAIGKSRRGLDLLVIDGFGDGFWPERWSEEDTGVRRRSGGLIDGDSVGLRQVFDIITSIRKDLGTVVALSIQGLWTNTSSPFFVPHLPFPYPTPFNLSKNDDPQHRSSHFTLNIQITLTGRVKALQLPADLTLVEALRISGPGAIPAPGTAGGAIQKTTQRYEGIVRVLGGQGSAGSLAGERFQFRIGPDGVEVWE